MLTCLIFRESFYLEMHSILLHVMPRWHPNLEEQSSVALLKWRAGLQQPGYHPESERSENRMGWPHLCSFNFISYSLARTLLGDSQDVEIGDLTTARRWSAKTEHMRSSLAWLSPRNGSKRDVPHKGTEICYYIVSKDSPLEGRIFYLSSNCCSCVSLVFVIWIRPCRVYYTILLIVQEKCLAMSVFSDWNYIASPISIRY